MSKEEELYFKIESYLKGELKGQELQSFEQELRKNDELQEKVNLHKLADDFVIANKLQEVKSIFQKEHEKATKSNRWKNLGLTLSALVVISTIIFTVKSEKNNVKSEEINVEKAISKNIVVRKPEEQKPVEVEKISENNSKKEESTAQSTSAQKPEKISSKQKQVHTTDSLKKAVISMAVDTLQEKPDLKQKKTDTTTVSQEKPEVKSTVLSAPDTTTSKVKAEAQKASPCENTSLSSDINANSTCIGKNEGSVSITQTSGGEAPYTYSLYNRENLEVPLTGLKAGRYKVVVSDINNCKSEDYIEVKDKSCPLDLHFNPSLGESLKIPKSESNGILTVYDQGGQVYYKQEIQSNLQEEWDGMSLSGETKPGYYIFTIEYRDNSVLNGTITISR